MEHKITVKEVLEVTKGKLISGKEDIVCDHFCLDSREVQSGDTYVGMKGEKVDGNAFYEMAMQKGASCLILQGVTISEDIKKQYANTAIILVENTVKALQAIAAYKRSLYQIPVVAITGSVGKTSTKDMVASVLSKKFHVLKTQGNFNNEIGLPLTVLSLKDHDAMVVEMGMNSFGEISTITKIAKPTVAVITNIGTAHIGMLGSRENILKAKLEILEGLQENGTVIVNNDNDLLHKWNETKASEYNVITYGIHEKSDVNAKEVHFTEEGSNYIVQIDGKQHFPVQVKVGGEHFVYNSLCAISVAKVFAIPMDQVLEGILHFELTKKRMEMKKAKNGATVINDCYNANFDSMKAAIDYLGKLSEGKKVAVLGDMLELGDFSKELHEKVGEVVAQNHLNLLICVGKDANYIAQKAKEGGMEESTIYCVDSNEKAIAILKEKLEKEDVVLLKASNALNFTQICEAICE